MSGFRKVLFLAAFIVGCTCCFTTEDLFGHGGRFRIPTGKLEEGDPDNQQNVKNAPINFPGSGPELSFENSDWEFWWYFNRDPYLDLKPTLLALTPKAGAIDFPFEKVTEKSQTQLVRFFSQLFREEKDQFVREAAVLSLARTHDESALPWIEFALDDKAAYVRHIAVLALGISQIQGAVPILESLVKSPNESDEIKMFAAMSVGLVGGDAARKVFEKWLEPKTFKGFKRFVQQGVAYGAGLTEDPTLGPLIRSALHNSLSEDRITTAYLLLSLGRLKDRAANAILIEHLDAKDIQARRSAVIAMGICASPSDKDVVESIIKKIDSDSDNLMKNFCFIALGQIGGETAEDYLAQQLEKVSTAYLPWVGLAVGLTRNPKHGPKVLKAFMGTKNLTVRSALAISLGLLNYKEGVGELRKAVDTAGAPVFRGYCALALGMLKDSESVDRLKMLYGNDANLELLQYTAEGLGLLGDRSITNEMVSMMGGSAASNIQVATAYNLGLIGDQKCIEPLVAIAGNRKNTTRLRAFALLGLGHLTDNLPIDVMTKIKRDNNYTIYVNFIFELYNVN